MSLFGKHSGEAGANKAGSASNEDGMRHRIRIKSDFKIYRIFTAPPLRPEASLK
jgi:hypothetical protein